MRIGGVLKLAELTSESTTPSTRIRQFHNVSTPQLVSSAPEAPYPADLHCTHREGRIMWRLGVSRNALYRTEILAAAWHVSLSEAVLGEGHISPQEYCLTLARECGIRALPGVNSTVLDASSPDAPPWRLLMSGKPHPMRNAGVPVVAFNVQRLSASAILNIAQAMPGKHPALRLMTRQTLIDAIIRCRGAALLRSATWGLRRTHPKQCAADGLKASQLVAVAGFVGCFAGGALISFRDTMTLLSAMLSFVFLMSVILRMMAAGQLLRRSWERMQGKPAAATPDAQLPIYTVLVPIFRETAVLPDLIAALRSLDYPAPKLDIKLILEETDEETVSAVRAMSLPANFDIIVVPDGQPRTKPKACNFALQFATGEYAVIYDAEDRPEPDQLRKAVAAFRRAPPEVVCLQAKLNFYNASENWLSKQFTIEYTSLFWGILPALDMLRLPIPLGGTSNHFRIRALRELGAWDAFNVTEDADLGMRIYRAGYRCKVLDSVTYEEAACQFGNWLRQRTRWLKGWMQTYAVHMREPGVLYRELGRGGFLAFQGLFAAVLISALAHPLFYILLIYDALHGSLLRQAESLLGWQFWTIAVFNLVAGYGVAAVLGVVALKMRGIVGLIPQITLIPVYWLLISFAAYRAAFQFVTKPFHWEKTEHGLSRMGHCTKNAAHRAIGAPSGARFPCRARSGTA